MEDERGFGGVSTVSATDERGHGSRGLTPVERTSILDDVVPSRPAQLALAARRVTTARIFVAQMTRRTEVTVAVDDYYLGTMVTNTGESTNALAPRQRADVREAAR